MQTEETYSGGMGSRKILGGERASDCYQCDSWVVGIRALEEVSDAIMHMFCS